MRKISLIDIGNLELSENCESVEIRPETVKIDVSACGICGSDLALLNGRRSIANENYFLYVIDLGTTMFWRQKRAFLSILILKAEMG